MNSKALSLFFLAVEEKEAQTLDKIFGVIRLRVDVFIIEQGFTPGWEPDELDSTAKHFIALENGKVVGTLRVRQPSPGEMKIERMCVAKDHRGRGIASHLLSFALKEMEKTKQKKILVTCQE